MEKFVPAVHWFTVLNIISNFTNFTKDSDVSLKMRYVNANVDS